MFLVNECGTLEVSKKLICTPDISQRNKSQRVVALSVRKLCVFGEEESYDEICFNVLEAINLDEARKMLFTPRELSLTCRETRDLENAFSLAPRFNCFPCNRIAKQ